MGFFSWKTQDSERSIANAYSIRKTFKVYMHDNQGNVYAESEYDGYGEFGGLDFYELMARMNGLKGRSEAIDVDCSGKEGYIYPNLTETADWQWRNEKPQHCEYQGYFYDTEA